MSTLINNKPCPNVVFLDILNYKGENFLKNNKTIIIKKKQVKVKRDNSQKEKFYIKIND